MVFRKAGRWRAVPNLATAWGRSRSPCAGLRTTSCRWPIEGPARKAHAALRPLPRRHEGMSTASMMNLSGGPCLGFGETGTGPTVVMVHGSPGEGRAWNNVIKQLPDSVRVLTPDLPGYGRSDPLPGGTTHRTQAMADAVAELIEQQDGAVWLCGHSYGANVALHAAVR